MAEKQTKYIFVTGGVVSGLGKGITAASLGRLLKCRGLKVASQKLDPIVIDPYIIFNSNTAFLFKIYSWFDCKSHMIL